MRTTIDLINELQEDAKRFTRVAIAVGFETTTFFVWSTDPDPLQMLNEAVQLGGKPVGVIAFQAEEFGGNIYSKLLVEHGDDPDLKQYVDTLSRQFLHSCRSAGFRTFEAPTSEDD